MRPRLPRAGPEGGGKRARPRAPEPLWPRWTRATRARLGPHTPPRVFFFFFRLFPSGLFLSSFLWQLERMLQQRMAAASSRFSEFRSLGAPHPTSCPNGPAGALAKATRTFSVFPSASLVSLLQVSEPRPGDVNPLAPGCVS